MFVCLKILLKWLVGESVNDIAHGGEIEWVGNRNRNGEKGRTMDLQCERGG